MTPGQMMKSRLVCQGVRSLHWVLNRIQNFQSFVEILDSALVASGNKRTGSFSLQTSTYLRVLSQCHRLFEVLTGRDQVAMQQIGFSDRLFQRKLLFNQSERFGAFKGAAVCRYDFINRKHTLGLSCCAFGVGKPTFIITGLNVMVGKALNRASRTTIALFQALCSLAVQTAAADWI